jgi:tRNA-splicing ligase RtcB
MIMKVEAHKNMLPIKMWCDDIESSAMQQAYNMAQLPFAFHHIALMPDCHSGYGMPIGGVLATKDVIVPNAVGVDIGCGMCAVKTSLLVEDWCKCAEFARQLWGPIMQEIRDQIPMGRNHHKYMVQTDYMPEWSMSSKTQANIVLKEWDSARYQLGTLGGGNHFIEIQKGDDGHIWIMLHSGSRNVGYKVAKHYNNVAIVLNRQWKSQVSPHVQLAFLPLDSDQGQDYFAEMNWCVKFALANREFMMSKIKCTLGGEFPGITFDEPINIAHNYAAMENHFGQNVMVHRKGATRARLGETGIIPGSMGTKSYIVRGLGNRESFHSCSHGAGRMMSRSAAKDNLDLDEEQAKMDDKGIVHGVRSQSDLDEAPGAYKDIDVVMESQRDLVLPIVELEPIAVLKG